MKIGVDLVTGINWNMTSWKTSDDPSLGSYTVWVNINGYPQLNNMEHESSLQQRIGYLNGLEFSGMLGLGPSNFYMFDFVFTHKEIYSNFTLVNDTYLTRMKLDPQGNFVQLVWNYTSQLWVPYAKIQQDQCSPYGICGPFGSCRTNNHTLCACLDGFEPMLAEEWSLAEWSKGFKRQIYLNPDKGHIFMRFTNLKFPDSQKSSFAMILYSWRKKKKSNNKGKGKLNKSYISPEYAANGLFSLKSDVFSFGVLVLEF
ncbi:hypothetical protein L1987_75434 [Smallanthus sonchifolius]|uniref:Uncharacterized protein n=1 Tax=Smallanthus sonchifolius TaxID=185202 RepID=A0ACB9A5I5_9ASTR|nr:hypothetical protein L1987_75434 [Smallanthus sonchifolius]